MTGVLLPDWLVAELPDVKPHGRVTAAGPSAVLYTAPDGSASTYPDVVSAYEALRDVDLEFSEELVSREGPSGVLDPQERREQRVLSMALGDQRTYEPGGPGCLVG
jgi:hypothetical protein